MPFYAGNRLIPGDGVLALSLSGNPSDSFPKIGDKPNIIKGKFLAPQIVKQAILRIGGSVVGAEIKNQAIGAGLAYHSRCLC